MKTQCAFASSGPKFYAVTRAVGCECVYSFRWGRVNRNERKGGGRQKAVITMKHMFTKQKGTGVGTFGTCGKDASKPTCVNVNCWLMIFSFIFFLFSLRLQLVRPFAPYIFSAVSSSSRCRFSAVPPLGRCVVLSASASGGLVSTFEPSSKGSTDFERMGARSM